MDKQRTIDRELSLKGVGLHTAHKANITFKPAEPDTGINFIRVDLPGRPMVRACIEYLLPQSRSLRRTSVGANTVEVHTVEHLMAALSGLGIDNLYIEIDNNEVPGMDGSSINFLEALKGAVKEQDKERQYYTIREPIFIEEEGASIIAVPSQEFKISYTLSYDHPLLKAQFLEVTITDGVFEKEIAPARTFCLEEEAEALRKQGVGQGADYTNTLVVGKNGVIKNKLRYDDEFIRHKMLDLLGDLYLVGQRIKGHIIALKSGHSLNLKLLNKISQQRQRYMSAGISSGSYSPPDGEGFGVEEIMKILPHREPFLFVDRIITLEKGKHVTGIKNVTINDYFFKGHFPGKPVMPGVIIIEAMAQVGGVMMLSLEENRGKLAYFLTIDNIKFRKTVVPGDQLVLDVTAVKIKSKTGSVHAKAYVEDKVVAEADLMFILGDSNT